MGCPAVQVLNILTFVQVLLAGQLWQEIGINFFMSQERRYLLVVNYYSNFFELVPLHKTTFKVIMAPSSAFARLWHHRR